METLLERYPEILQSTTDQKLELIDELWACVRRDDNIAVPPGHQTELDNRLATILKDPSLALDPASARALLKPEKRSWNR